MYKKEIKNLGSHTDHRQSLHKSDIFTQAKRTERRIISLKVWSTLHQNAREISLQLQVMCSCITARLPSSPLWTIHTVGDRTAQWICTKEKNKFQWEILATPTEQRETWEQSSNSRRIALTANFKDEWLKYIYMWLCISVFLGSVPSLRFYGKRDTTQ